MSCLFLEYPKCSTCRKAKKWLEENNIDFTDRMIVEENPTKEELKAWYEKSGVKLNKFFNTSGKLYREMNLKDKVKTASEDEVKRPLLIKDDLILIGFKEEEWAENLK